MYSKIMINIHNPFCNSEVMDSKPLPQYTAIPAVYFGKEPIDTFCIHCGNRIRTSTEFVTGPCTHISAAVISTCNVNYLFWCGCCLIPYCVDDCMDVLHKCPHCQRELGRFKRF
ncbi:unnamed protein product [Rodentolepis nana]|uniref:LITAF domain-containing protein n=1 Tax=Rodentolepis nana TaxID=102285 RepID=A0A0R3T953_RODNA|nr:unnamed protein product [Rodentolepis nana]